MTRSYTNFESKEKNVCSNKSKKNAINYQINFIHMETVKTATEINKNEGFTRSEKTQKLNK